MKLLRQIGIQFGVTFVALALLFTLGAPALQRFEGHPAIQKAIYTLGFAGEAYAITPDYEVDGNADDVQVQQALNALPVTGGKLVLYAGNWHFNATVSRAINNVTIEGDGKGTYIVNNAATALFSAGAQTGWVFKDFRTDAGWVTVSSAGDTRFLGALWKGTELVSNVVASGATMPASPVKGQEYFQDTTGRQILYSYNGSAWTPLTSYGAMTLYVDHTDGTDDLNHGTGVDTNAFKHIQYALNLVQPITYLGGTVTINVNGENYGEDLTFTGVSPGTVNVMGTNSIVASLVATGGGKGTATAAANVTGAFGVGAYDNYLISFTSGANSGTVFPIGKTTTGALYLTGQGLAANPVGGDTYQVLGWSTITSSFHASNSRTDISFFGFKFDGSGAPYDSKIFYFFQSRVGLAYSNITTASYDMWVPDRSFGNMLSNVLVFTANNYHWAVIAGDSNPDIFNTRIVGVGNNNNGIQITYNGYVAMRGCEIVGMNNAVQGHLGGILDGWTALVPSFIHGNNYGLYLHQHSQAVRTSSTYIIYGKYLDGSAHANTTTNVNADAASFSWNEGP